MFTSAFVLHTMRVRHSISSVGSLMPTFEQAFNDLENASASTLKSVSDLSKLIKQVQKAAQQGNIAALKRTQGNLNQTLSTLRQGIDNIANLWTFQEEDEETYLREHYIGELLTASQGKGLNIHMSDGTLISHPSVVRVLPNERAVRIDRKKNSSIRPSHVVNLLLKNQQKKSPHKSQAFLESLYSVYMELTKEHSLDRLTKGSGRVVPLDRVYRMLTSLPGSTREYDRTDFARDIYVLDVNGPQKTKKCATVSFPASTGAKQSTGVFPFVGPDGRTVVYYGLSFSEE